MLVQKYEPKISVKQILFYYLETLTDGPAVLLRILHNLEVKKLNSNVSSLGSPTVELPAILYIF